MTRHQMNTLTGTERSKPGKQFDQHVARTPGTEKGVIDPESQFV